MMDRLGDDPVSAALCICICLVTVWILWPERR